VDDKIWPNEMYTWTNNSNENEEEYILDEEANGNQQWGN
jgi:hypothetical protein